MAYKITDECLSCGVCCDECPNKAIFEDKEHYMIDPEKCTSCGACTESCPNEAIVEEKQSK